MRDAVPVDRLGHVMRTARLEATSRPENRGDRKLIATDQHPDRPPSDAALRRAHERPAARMTSVESCSYISPDSSRVAAARAITTRSSAGSVGCSRRNHSRIRRFTRLRATAFPTLRLAVMPSRGPLESRGATRMTNALDTARRPCCATCSYSGDRSSRWDRRNRAVAAATLLGGDRDRDPLAALGAPALEHVAPSGALHAPSEAVNSLPPDPARLVGALHR